MIPRNQIPLLSKRKEFRLSDKETLKKRLKAVLFAKHRKWVSAHLASVMAEQDLKKDCLPLGAEIYVPVKKVNGVQMYDCYGFSLAIQNDFLGDDPTYAKKTVLEHCLMQVGRDIRAHMKSTRKAINIIL